MNQEQLETALSQVQKRIGVKFVNPNLLLRALTHHSNVASPSKQERMDSSNEGLEFLGDRVLGCVIASILVRDLRRASPGHLNRAFDQLVSGSTLTALAKELDLGSCFFRDERLMPTLSPRMLAETFEAIVAAIFLDQGFETASKFLTSLYAPRLAEIVQNSGVGKGAKQRFEEYIQRNFKVSPRYEVLRTQGSGENQMVVVGVHIRNHLFAEGEGHDKTAACNNAIQSAMNKLGRR